MINSFNKDLKGLKMARQAGVTMVELAMVIAIIAFLSGLWIFASDGSRSQGVGLYSQLNQYSDALRRLRMDTQCYPNKTAALFDYEQADTSHCGLDLRNNWRGPYAQSTQVNSNNNIALNQYAEGANLVLPPRSVGLNSTSNRIQYAVVANNIPSDVINVVMEECNNGYADEEQTVFKEGQCFILESNADNSTAITNPSRDFITEDTNTYSVGMIFDERR